MTNGSTRGTPGVLAVICDVGPSTGIGHLMRCVALAEEFAGRGSRVVIVADVAAVPFALEQVTRRGFAHLGAPGSTGEYLGVLAGLGAEAVVIDSYLLPDDLYGSVAAAYPTLVLVDGDPGGRVGTVLVDQNIGAEDDPWPVPEGSTRLAGLDFALMRTEILDRRPEAPRESENEPLRVFAFFGGTDAFGAGPVLTAALLATGLPLDLRVVGPQPWDRVPAAGPGQRVTVIAPTEQLADEVLGADLVVSAAGTSSWELLCLGAACALVCVADNQALSYSRAVDGGLCTGLGRLEDVVADPAAAVAELAAALSDAGRRRALRARGHARVDGAGRARVADAFAAAGPASSTIL